MKMPEVIDIAYELKGDALPAGYVFALWPELVRVLPWLESEEAAGILPVRGTEKGGAMLLPQRARLLLRMPAEKVQEAQQLSGQTLDVAGHSLKIGAAQLRPLQAHPTLHAHLVVSEGDESAFLEKARALLSELDIECKMICGRRVNWTGEFGSISGYSLVVHELKPEVSLRLQATGLGRERRFGCGIFVPYKVIAGLE
jgi:CRISPR-associated protein Cas6